MMKVLQRDIQKELELYKHLGKVRRYLDSVMSYVGEQPPETNMTIHLGDDVTQLSAGQALDLLKRVDTDIYSLQIMSEHSIAMMEEQGCTNEYTDEELPPLPKMNFIITDNHRYRANGLFIGIVANLFFEQIERGM